MINMKDSVYEKVSFRVNEHYNEVKKYLEENKYEGKILVTALYGSQNYNIATESSDVDLLLSTSLSGMKFYELVEILREELQKKVDVLKWEQLKDNPDLIHEILKDGVKIYG